MTRKIISLLFLTILGCAHGEVTPVGDVEKLEGGETALILPVSVSADSCRLTLHQTQPLKDYSVSVHRGIQRIVIELPPGAYSLFDLNCGKNKTWDFTSKNWAPMVVVDGQISGGAPMDFRISENGGMTTYFFNRSGVQKTYHDLFARLKPSAQAHLISAYSKKPITAKMITQSQYQITVKLPAKHLVQGEPDEANYPDFKSCYTTEFNTNPLYVGHISLTATYAKKIFSKTDLVDNISLYTDQFYKCAQDVLKKFQPNRSDDLVYDIVL